MAPQSICGEVNNQNESGIRAISDEQIKQKQDWWQERGEGCVICHANKHEPDSIRPPCFDKNCPHFSQ